jgi:hypothetical protein
MALFDDEDLLAVQRFVWLMQDSVKFAVSDRRMFPSNPTLDRVRQIILCRFILLRSSVAGELCRWTTLIWIIQTKAGATLYVTHEGVSKII